MGGRYWIDVKPEDFQYGEQYSLQTYGGKDSTLVREIEHTGAGDYSGGTVEMSNYRVIKNDPALQDKVAYGYSGYGYKSVIVPIFEGQKTPEEISEIEERLNDYPLLDEDEHSQLEMELEGEAWNDYGRDEFIKDALVPFLDQYLDMDKDEMKDVLDEKPDEVWRVYHAVRENGPGDEVVFETGGSAYFNTKRMLSQMNRGDEDDKERYLAPLYEVFPELVPEPEGDVGPIILE
jgi:hypothetical protein